MVSSRDRCSGCGVRLSWAPTGRPREYCGATCRSRAYRERIRRERAGAVFRNCLGCTVGRADSSGWCADCRDLVAGLPDVVAGRLIDQVPHEPVCSCGLCPDSQAVPPVLPPYYGKPIDTPDGHRWAGYRDPV